MKAFSRFFRGYFLGYVHWYAGGVFFLFLTNWLGVQIPLSMGRALDALRAGQPVGDEVWHIGAMGAGVILVRTLSRVLFFTPGRLAEFELKNDLFQHLTQLDPGFFAKHPAGDIVSRSTNDITWIRAMVGFGSLQVVNVLVSLLVTGREMVKLSPALFGYVAVPVVIAAVVMQAGIHSLQSLNKTSLEQLSQLTEHIHASLQGVHTIQGYNAEPAFQARFLEKNQAYLRTQVRMAWIRGSVLPLITVAGAVATWLLIAVGGPRVVAGELSVGELAAFITFVGLVLFPLTMVGWLVSVIQRGIASLERVDEVLNAEVARPEGDNPLPVPEGPPSIEVRGLEWRYGSEGSPVLHDLSFSVPAGGTLGIYGATGSGKSTLLRLLSRTLDPPPGAVLVGGVDLSRLERRAWRRAISVVPQVPFLFSDTIARNVSEDRAVAEEAVGRAALGPDLKVLPAGLDTVVGERGIMLSGGQRQRVALARGLARPHRLLLLDDVLAAVDQQTEQVLVDQLVGGPPATRVIVSHRVAVLARCDHVLVLEGGRLVDQGSHTELLSRPGPYREAWAQLGERE